MAVSRAILAVIVVLVLIIAALGSYAVVVSSRGTTTAASGTSNTSLINACRSEGGVLTIYGDLDTSDWPTADKVLTSEFPWFKVTYVGLSPIDIVTRATSEYQAGHVTADIFIDGWVELYRLKAVGALQNYSNYVETLENYSSNWVDPTGYIHPSAEFPIVIIYNTNLVTNNATLPKSYTDIANSQWKGKIAMDGPAFVDTSASLFTSLFVPVFHGNNASFTSFLKAVAANNPIQTGSAGDAYTAVASGQAAIGIDLLNDAIGLFAPHPNAPVGIDMLNTTYVLPDGTSLAKGAPHPACGEFFLQFWASYSGQRALALTGRIPELTPLTNAFLSQFPLPPTTYVPAGLNTTLYTNGAGWASYYSNIFGPG